MAAASNSPSVRIVSLLIAICVVGISSRAECGGSSLAASAETSTYVFVPDRSKLVQTGGIAGVHWTYSIKGEFQLTVDPNAGSALFAHVDANATDDSQFKRTLDLNHVFNMTSLVGTVEPNGSIKFTGNASADSDVLITVILMDDLACLVGQTTPPPNSADFFIFGLGAVAQFRKYGGGSGTADDPYKIATAEDLIGLGETPEDYGRHFILTADIDLAGYVFDKAVIAPGACGGWGCRFVGVPFTGVLDGNDHTIFRLTIQGESYLGLVGQLGRLNAPAGEVKNVRVIDANITGSGRSVGPLVGSNDGSVIHCYSAGTVSGYSDVGGLVGGNNTGTVTQCWSTGTVGGKYDVGGLVGGNGNGYSEDWPPGGWGRVTYCYSTGAVTGDEYVGGLVGANGGFAQVASVVYCYSTGAVDGNDYVGGLVGENYWGAVTNCYRAGMVSGENCVGGLVGENYAYGEVTQCYSTGAVSGDGNDVGGLVGATESDWGATVLESFWDIQTSGQATSAGGEGKTTAEMQTASTFLEAGLPAEAGWDFVNIWGIGENQTYPYLRKYSAADINRDASVNFLDLAVLAENWLTDISHP